MFGCLIILNSSISCSNLSAGSLYPWSAECIILAAQRRVSHFASHTIPYAPLPSVRSLWSSTFLNDGLCGQIATAGWDITGPFVSREWLSVDRYSLVGSREDVLSSVTDESWHLKLEWWYRACRIAVPACACAEWNACYVHRNGRRQCCLCVRVRVQRVLFMWKRSSCHINCRVSKLGSALGEGNPPLVMKLYCVHDDQLSFSKECY